MPADVTRLAALAAPAREVWAVIGDFGALDQWMPGLRHVEVREVPAQPGGVEREITTVAGDRFLERLLAVDDASMCQTYTMPEPGFPISEHRASMEVLDAGSDRSTVRWSASFVADPADVPGVDEAMGAAFQYGLDALVERFGAPEARP